MEATASSSDCQFCSVRSQKSGSARYSAQDTGSCRAASCRSSNAATPATDWASHDATMMPPITGPSELAYRASR